MTAVTEIEPVGILEMSGDPWEFGVGPWEGGILGLYARRPGGGEWERDPGPIGSRDDMLRRVAWMARRWPAVTLSDDVRQQLAEIERKEQAERERQEAERRKAVERERSRQAERKRQRELGRHLECKRVTYTCCGPYGEWHTPALAAGGLAHYQAAPRRWSVGHVATGRAVWQDLSSRDAARALHAALLAITDWTVRDLPLASLANRVRQLGQVWL